MKQPKKDVINDRKKRRLETTKKKDEINDRKKEGSRNNRK